MSETELKLMLPGADPNGIAAQLARHPVLRRRARQVQDLHNVYYDTPDQRLRRLKVALRVRRQITGEPARAQWILTLKTAGVSVGGLSQRGEWEASLPDATPQLSALHGTPWATLDPDGSIWGQLAPAFITTCTRTLWLVRQRGGSEIEVALDVGEVVAGDRRWPICELELELKAGPPQALHLLAQRLAASVAVLPGQVSKAERGNALARNEAHLPTRARAVALNAEAPLPQAAADVLADVWDQTLRNAALLMHHDAPELLHQARVGWRRLRSVARLLRPLLGPTPQTPALQAFWQASGSVRELDVMLTETLPAWAAAYARDDPLRQADWATLLLAVATAREQALVALRALLAEPATGVGWLAWGEWLQAVARQPAPPARTDWTAWLAKRLARQHNRLKRLRKALHTQENQAEAAPIGGAQNEAERHAWRLNAKRLRYSTEAFASVLPRRAARRWLKDAAQAQTIEGQRRDLQQCVAWLERLAVPAGPLAFMQGVNAGVMSR